MTRGDKESLLKRLLDLSSREASLKFKLSRVLEEARIETIRLSGMLATCEALRRPGYEEIRRDVEDLINKYVLCIRHCGQEHLRGEADRSLEMAGDYR